MQPVPNLNTTDWSKNSESSHDGLDDNYSYSSGRLRKRIWRSPTMLFKRRWQSTRSQPFLTTDPEKSSFFTTSAVGLRSHLLVHPAGWGAAFQNGLGRAGNGRTKFGEDSMIETSCVSSSAQSRPATGISATLAATLIHRVPHTKALSHPFCP